MLLFFLKIMTQNCGTYVTVQLLQTLNILFENIRNETSLCEYNFFTLIRFNNSDVSLLFFFKRYRYEMFICSIFLFLDFLLSNNHVNSIIVHKFDFGNEEVQ